MEKIIKPKINNKKNFKYNFDDKNIYIVYQ